MDVQTAYHTARHIQRMRNLVNDAYRIDGRDVIDGSGYSTLSGLYERFCGLPAVAQRAAKRVEGMIEEADELSTFEYHRNLRGWGFPTLPPARLPNRHAKLPD